MRAELVKALALDLSLISGAQMDGWRELTPQSSAVVAIHMCYGYSSSPSCAYTHTIIVNEMKEETLN